MKKVGFLLVGLFFIFAGISNIFAQSNSGIVGFIFNTSRQPVDNIYVELQDEYGSTIRRVRTNGSGLYSFRGIPQGYYNIKVLSQGTSYQEQTKRITLVMVSASRDNNGRGSGAVNEQVDFYLNQNRAFVGPLAAPEVIFAQSVPKKAEEVYQKGVELLADDKEQEGFDKLKEALEIFPEYFAALDRLGQEYVVKEYYQPAYILFTNALKVNSRSYSSLFGLGITQFRLGQVDDSIKSLKQAVSFQGDSAGAYLWLGIALNANDKFKEAEESLTTANKLSKNKSADVHWQLARLYVKIKRFGEAADELELYLKYNNKAQNAGEITQTISNLRKKATNN